MSDEIELKLELDPGDAGSVAEQAAFRNLDARSESQVSVYYDTPGGKLRKKGLSLRVRSTSSGFVQTVKSLDAAAGLFSRGEWEAPVASLEADLDKLAETPAGELHVRKLRPVVRSEVDRTVWQVEGDGSSLEAALDDGGLSAGGRKASLCELELELLKGEPETAFRTARTLAQHLPLKLGVLSKAERGFALADDVLGKATRAGPVPVRHDMSVAEGFATIAQSCIRHFRLNEPIVLERRDPAALHQSRVAMRRLRAALSIFRPALADPQFEPLRQELRRFTQQLGEARDLDVYLERKRLPAGVRKALRRERERAYDRVVEAFQAKRVRILMIDLVAWITLGRWRHGEKARRPLADFAPRRIGRLWQKVAAHGELEPMDDEERHELRIEIKKLRYALEFVRPLHARIGRKQKRFAEAVEALQESLGVLNDMATVRIIAEKVGDKRVLATPDSAKRRARCLADAQQCLDRLREIGPYWSKSA